jgi:hypothetical protein
VAKLAKRKGDRDNELKAKEKELKKLEKTIAEKQ